MPLLRAGGLKMILLLAFAVVSGMHSAQAAPAISRLSVRGLQTGSATVVVIDGSELGPGSALLTSAPGVTMQVRPSSTSKRLEAEIAVDGQTPPGIYLMRLSSVTGVSNAVAIGIDSLPQMPFGSALEKLPAALTGELTGNAVLGTSFTGRQGQRVVAEIESRRLGGKLKPVVRLLNSRRTQIAWGKPSSLIGGDTRCEAVLPADDTYSIELNDLVYRGEGPGIFRLKIGDLQFADLTFPLGVEANKPATLSFLSTSFSADVRASGTFAGFGLEAAPWPSGIANVSGSRPVVAVRPTAELIEQRTESQPQDVPAAPVGVSGRLSARGEQDLYRLPVTPGQVLRLDVFAHRLGLPTDLSISVKNEQQAVLAANDDLPGSKDPGLDLTVPAGVNTLLIGVQDALNLGNPLTVYRLQVNSAGSPDFSLSLAEDMKQVPAGGTALVRVHADRHGYNGPIKLAVTGLSSSLSASEATIEPGSTDTLVSIAAPAAGGPSGLVNVIGESVGLNPPLVRTALVPDTPIYSAQPWSRKELAIGVAPPPPVTVVWTLPANADARLPIASHIPLNVRIERATSISGPVRLAIISALNVPTKSILENGKPKPVDDIDRTIHLAGEAIVSADQNALTTELIVPFDLTATACDATLSAELLSGDGKSVVATVYSPIQRLYLVSPTPEKPLAIFEDQPEVVAALTEGGGQIALHEAEKYSGKASVRVTPPQRFTPRLPGLEARIREKPAAGEYRYLRFVWKKPAGNVVLQLAHDGQFGPIEKRSFRYQAGQGPEYGGMAIRVDAQQPPQFTLVTRDLFADFGEFTLTGIALTAVDGDAALFDHIYLGRTPTDFDLVRP